jgi:hypothetical protein
MQWGVALGNEAASSHAAPLGPPASRRPSLPSTLKHTIDELMTRARTPSEAFPGNASFAEVSRRISYFLLSLAEAKPLKNRDLPGSSHSFHGCLGHHRPGCIRPVIRIPTSRERALRRCDGVESIRSRPRP